VRAATYPLKKRLAFGERLHCRQQLARCIRLDDVAARADRQRHFHHVPRFVRAEEQDSRARIVRQNAPSHFEAVNGGEADVQQNQIGPQRFRLLHRLEPVGRFTDNLPLTIPEERGTDLPPPQRVIVNDERAADRMRRPQHHASALGNKAGIIVPAALPPSCRL